MRTEQFIIAIGASAGGLDQINKYFLQLSSPKKTYEIISVDNAVLVLSDIASSEKIFFSKDDCWNSHLDANKRITL